METEICGKCKKPKPIKAKGLCNACCTAGYRKNKEAKEKEPNNMKDTEKVEELELKLKEVKESLSKQVEMNLILTKALSMKEIPQNTTTLKGTSELPSKTTKEAELSPKKDGLSPNSPLNTKEKDLSTLFIEEVQNKTFDYDKDKYKEYFEEVSKKKNWKSMGEKKLVELFPCFSVLIEQYNEKIISKRSKLERELIQEGKVESKSLVETKGRMVTSAGQFFLLLQKISQNGKVVLEDLFDAEKIKFMEDLGREPSSIRNLLLILKLIIKNFKSSNTFLPFQSEMIKASTFLDLQCSNQKSQDFNKILKIYLILVILLKMESLVYLLFIF